MTSDLKKEGLWLCLKRLGGAGQAELKQLDVCGTRALQRLQGLHRAGTSSPSPESLPYEPGLQYFAPEAPHPLKSYSLCLQVHLTAITTISVLQERASEPTPTL